MKFNITTISENTASPANLLGEHGLSILIETDNTGILFDTGQTISASHNLDALSIDTTKIDKIVLSHGHFDHTGGLRSILLKLKREIEIIAHPDIWTAKYIHAADKPDRYIGIPFQQEELESLGARFRYSTKPVTISDDIITTGEVPMTTDFEALNPDMMIKTSNGWQQDQMPDDQAMIIKADQGLVIILGCAHRGIINTLYHARQLTGNREIYAVLGGCHLVDAGVLQLKHTFAVLKELRIQRLGLSHCTSLPVSALMAVEFSKEFFFNNAGTVYNV